MRTIKKNMKAAIAQGKSWNQELNAFLLNYRATPHSSTGAPPATLLFGREIQTSLPRLSSSQPNPNVCRKDADAKEKMKTYADQKRHVKECIINIGDSVLLKREGMKKSSPEYDPKPWKVTKRNESMITVERNGRTVTRNSSRFKPSPRSPEETADESDDDIDVPFPPPNQAPRVQPHLPPPPAGRPQRQRRRPARLNDFVV
jgi:hypothetical protein